MLGMWHKSAYECGVAVSVWIVSTRPIAVIRDCAEWQYLYATSDSSLCLIIPNLLWIIGECQGYAVYLIRTIEHCPGISAIPSNSTNSCCSFSLYIFSAYSR